MNRKNLIIFCIMLSATFMAFSSNASISTELPATDIRQKIIAEFTTWKGVKYRFGGTTMKGIDCSALMQKIYHGAFYGVLPNHLPRTTTQQINQGVKTRRNDLKTGDLVFFRISANQRHVGVYIGDDKFVHASPKKGVIISSLENYYWSARYDTARRVIL